MRLLDRPRVPMKLTSSLSEAWRNVVTGTSRFTLWAIALAAMSSFICSMDGMSVRQIVIDAEAYRAAGSNVLLLSAAGGINGVACDSLGLVPGVIAAGAIRSSPAGLTVAALRATPIPLQEATPGMFQLLGAGEPEGPPPSFIISASLADQLGLHSGDELATSEGAAHVDHVFPYPSDGRDPTLEYSAVAAVNASGLFDQCWVEMWPMNDNMKAVIAATVDSNASARIDIQTRQLNISNGATFDGQARFETRWSRFGMFAGLLFGFILGVMMIRLRRLELASALHAGVVRVSLEFQVVAEAVVIALTSVLLSVPIITLISVETPHGARLPLFMIQVAVPLASGGGAVFGAFAAATAIQERYLFGYFQDR